MHFFTLVFSLAFFSVVFTKVERCACFSCVHKGWVLCMLCFLVFMFCLNFGVWIVKLENFLFSLLFSSSFLTLTPFFFSFFFPSTSFLWASCFVALPRYLVLLPWGLILLLRIVASASCCASCCLELLSRCFVTSSCCLNLLHCCFVALHAASLLQAALLLLPWVALAVTFASSYLELSSYPCDCHYLYVYLSLLLVALVPHCLLLLGYHCISSTF